MARVVTVSLNIVDVAYPFTLLEQRRVVMDVVGGQPIVVFYAPGTTSALDGATIATSRDVGAAAVYRPTVGRRPLTFTWHDNAIEDSQTGSRWSVLGRATDGPLAGQQIEPVVHDTPFWFAWAAFRPATRIAQ